MTYKSQLFRHRGHVGVGAVHDAILSQWVHAGKVLVNIEVDLGPHVEILRQLANVCAKVLVKYGVHAGVLHERVRISGKVLIHAGAVRLHWPYHQRALAMQARTHHHPQCRGVAGPVPEAMATELLIHSLTTPHTVELETPQPN